MKIETREQAEVVLKFPTKDFTQDQWDALFEAQKWLSKAGIHFDSGAGCGYRDWELDWSLEGAEVFCKNHLIEEQE